MSTLWPLLFESGSVEETEAAGADLGRQLRAGDVVLLQGELGSGKTAFARGIVRGAGSEEHVSSPTYVFIHEYRGGRVPVAHADLYRLGSQADAEDLGLDEYTRGEWILLVEWPERAEAVAWPEHWAVRLVETGPDSRSILIRPPEARKTS